MKSKPISWRLEEKLPTDQTIKPNFNKEKPYAIFHDGCTASKSK
jgi:hypothetical protein